MLAIASSSTTDDTSAAFCWHRRSSHCPFLNVVAEAVALRSKHRKWVPQTVGLCHCSQSSYNWGCCWPSPRHASADILPAHCPFDVSQGLISDRHVLLAGSQVPETDCVLATLDLQQLLDERGVSLGGAVLHDDDSAAALDVMASAAGLTGVPGSAGMLHEILKYYQSIEKCTLT